MTTYVVTMASGESWWLRANFAQASDPIRTVNYLTGEEYTTPYRVVDARHSPQRAAELVLARYISQGGS